ncbi:hypothetical protein [Streptomyces sp. Ag109_O5-1]|uniref:hypothetical protein n=1 Tax=Streptomyces sp. Ag109_O5-1 TaxID=1938851 RepID=UPI000F4EB09F|nr:hypothetical protein [Streptomyces sp. Ag109_O5-1]
MREARLDWERVARETVGNLRAGLARHPDDHDHLATPDDSDRCLVAVTPADRATEDALRRLMTGPGLPAVGA